MSRAGRNDPCPCGSGRKYKHCCIGSATATARPDFGLASVAAMPKSPPPAAAAMPPVALLAQASGHYNAGRLQEAEQLCRQILGRDPRHADTLHLLGLIARRVGRNDVAVELFRQALGVAPGEAVYLNNLGNALKDLGRPAEAVDAYARAVALAADIAEIHNNLGSALQALGRLDAAVAAYRRALQLKPAYGEAHSNLGTVLAALGSLDEAIACQHRAIELDPQDLAAFSNLGNALQAAGRHDEALAAYRQALALGPDAPGVLTNLGSLLQVLGRHDDAIACLERSAALRDDSPETFNNLGNAYVAAGRQEAALVCFERVLQLDPQHPVARHFVASLQRAAPDSAPREYVETLFDACADRFDTTLVEALAYRTPAEIVALAGRHAAPPPGGWTLLDLGCGTGLVAVAAAPQAREIVGVDLSARMLAHAAARGLYRRLVHADLLAMMQGEGDASFDLVVAADVFVYLGRLDDVVAEARRLLRPGGLFVFSVESLDALGETGAAFRLNPSGRYAHAAACLDGLAAATGFVPVERREVQVRLESGRPVLAWLSAWRA